MITPTVRSTRKTEVEASEISLKTFCYSWWVFSRYDPEMGEIHKDMNGEGIIFLAVDCVPTELPKEVGNAFSFCDF